MKMKIRILEARGIYKAGDVVDTSMAHGQQWIASGFAEYAPDEPKVKPKKEAPKKKAKPKADKQGE